MILTSLVSGYLFIITQKKNNLEITENLRALYIETEKEQVKRTINEIIIGIDIQRECLLNMINKGELSDDVDLEKAIQQVAENNIRSAFTGENCYLWVNKILNYDGGDDYAIRLIHPNLTETEGMLLSTNMQDVKGGYPYAEELDGVNKNGELFFSYWFKKLNSDEFGKKLSYARLYEPWDWIIAGGVYFDDLDEELRVQNNKFNKILSRNIRNVLIVEGIIIFLILFISLIIHKKYDSILNHWIGEAETKQQEIIKLNEGLENIVSERTLQLKDALAAEERANCAKTEFLSNISHEIRTPLNGIEGMFELLSVTELDDEQKKYVSAGYTSINRLSKVLIDILNMSMIESGNIYEEKVSFNIREVFESAVVLFKGETDNKDVAISFEITQGVPEFLNADLKRIRQILFNVIGNAVKFTNKGEIKAFCRIEKIENTDMLCFEVIDTGVGISHEYQSIIFDEFTRGEGPYSRTAEGLGIGLSVVKRLVDFLGGTINLESIEGEGTQTKILLPLAANDLT